MHIVRGSPPCCCCCCCCCCYALTCAYPLRCSSLAYTRHVSSVPSYVSLSCPVHPAPPSHARVHGGLQKPAAAATAPATATATATATTTPSIVSAGPSPPAKPITTAPACLHIRSPIHQATDGDSGGCLFERRTSTLAEEETAMQLLPLRCYLTAKKTRQPVQVGGEEEARQQGGGGDGLQDDVHMTWSSALFARVWSRAPR